MGRLCELAGNRQTSYSDDCTATTQPICIAMSNRSPIILWLLLAASISVYAVVSWWVASQPFPTPPHAVAMFDALTFCWLALITMGAMFRSTKSIASRLAPVVAALAAGLYVAGVAASPVSYWDQFRAYLPVYGLYVAFLVAALWALRRTKFWQRRYGNASAWQISLAELLIVMTAVAVLTVAIRGSPFLGDSGWLVVAVLLAMVAVAVACAAFWSLAIHPVFRFAGTLAVAVGSGIALAIVTGFEPRFAEIIGGDLLVQAVVISIWLALGNLLPPINAAAGDAESLAR